MLERIAGNTRLKEDLRAALQTGRLPHCVLLVGEAGCGAGFAARCLAADYLYPQGGPHAEAVLREEDSECITLRGEGASGQIKIGSENNPERNTVRWARNQIQKSALSTEAKGRVMILYGAQNLNESSANALLKHLEEPPAGVLFVLTAVSAATVLPTIRSRCAVYMVAPVPTEECTAQLRRTEIMLTAEQAETLSFLYEGHIGTCLNAVRKPPVRQARENARRLLLAAQQGETFETLAILAEVEKDKAAAAELLWQATFLGSAALRRPGFEGIDPLCAERVIRAADQLRAELAGNGNLRLLLTVFGMQISQQT